MYGWGFCDGGTMLCCNKICDLLFAHCISASMYGRKQQPQLEGRHQTELRTCRRTVLLAGYRALPARRLNSFPCGLCRYGIFFISAGQQITEHWKKIVTHEIEYDTCFVLDATTLPKGWLMFDSMFITRFALALRGLSRFCGRAACFTWHLDCSGGSIV